MRRALPLACALAGLALATQCAGAAPLTAGAQAAAGIRIPDMKSTVRLTVEDSRIPQFHD
jgi:hypothetical protein